MRFYNHSTIPGELLKPLVKHALQLSKINPKVIVLITRSKESGGRENENLPCSPKRIDRPQISI